MLSFFITYLLFCVEVANSFYFSSPNYKPTCGKLIYGKRFQSASTKGFIKDPLYADKNILFNGSYVIQEARKADFFIDANKKETVDTSVTHYIFFDLKKKGIYEFSSFSDTARLLKKYPLIDSAFVDNGWNFYRYSNLIYRESIKRLPDTLIDGITYQRITGTKTIKGIKEDAFHTRTGYIRSDINNSLFHFDRALDDSLGCTMVRIDYTVMPQNIGMSSSMNFVRKGLTPEELKVFDAWGRFAKKNPVVK